MVFSYSVNRYREIMDLVASFIVLGTAFSIRYIIVGAYNQMMAAFFAVGLGFLVHELAHRYVANFLGVLSRYRAWYPGLAIALLIAIASRGAIIFAAPGAVEVFLPWYLPKTMAMISLAGPFANIMVSVLCIAISLIPYASHIYQYLTLVGYINAFLGFFNLLPIPPLDGYKAVRGSVTRWIPLFIISLILILYYRIWL